MSAEVANVPLVENGRSSAKLKEEADSQLHVRLPRSMLTRFCRAARRSGMSLAEWCRLHLEQAADDMNGDNTLGAEIPHCYQGDPVRTALDVVRLNSMVSPDNILAAVRFAGLAVPFSHKPLAFWRGLERHKFIRSDGHRTTLTPKGMRVVMGFNE